MKFDKLALYEAQPPKEVISEIEKLDSLLGKLAGFDGRILSESGLKQEQLAKQLESSQAETNNQIENSIYKHYTNPKIRCEFSSPTDWESAVVVNIHDLGVSKYNDNSSNTVSIEKYSGGFDLKKGIHPTLIAQFELEVLLAYVPNKKAQTGYQKRNNSGGSRILKCKIGKRTITYGSGEDVGIKEIPPEVIYLLDQNSEESFSFGNGYTVRNGALPDGLPHFDQSQRLFDQKNGITANSYLPKPERKISFKRYMPLIYLVIGVTLAAGVGVYSPMVVSTLYQKLTNVPAIISNSYNEVFNKGEATSEGEVTVEAGDVSN